MLEIGDLAAEERERDRGADARPPRTGHTFESALAEASTLLSGVSRGAGVVVTTKQNPRLKHIEFVRLEPTRALVVLVSEDGSVENRLVDLPPGLPPSGADRGRELPQRPHPRPHARRDQERDRGPPDRDGARARRDHGAARRGRRRDELGRRPKPATSSCAARRTCSRTCARSRTSSASACSSPTSRPRPTSSSSSTRAEGGEGVRIFIGSENKLFSLSGSSMIAAPFRDASAEDRRRPRRHRPDAAELRPHRADGRLHGEGGEPDFGGRALERDDLSPSRHPALPLV